MQPEERRNEILYEGIIKVTRKNPDERMAYNIQEYIKDVPGITSVSSLARALIRYYAKAPIVESRHNDGSLLKLKSTVEEVE